MKVKINKEFLMKNGFIYIGKTNLLVVQKSGEKEKWARVLMNIKLKYFKANLKDDFKIVL